MATLTDMYGSGSPLASSLVPFGTSDSDVREDAGLETQRALHLYGTRALPNLVNRYAARGTFYSGGARVAADQLREDVGTQTGDIQRLLTRQLSKMARDRILATLGGLI